MEIIRSASTISKMILKDFVKLGDVRLKLTMHSLSEISFFLNPKLHKSNPPGVSHVLRARSRLRRVS